MKVIVVKPFTNPYISNIKGDLKSMQALVGGYIEVIYPFDNQEIALTQLKYHSDNLSHLDDTDFTNGLQHAF